MVSTRIQGLAFIFSSPNFATYKLITFEMHSSLQFSLKTLNDETNESSSHLCLCLFTFFCLFAGFWLDEQV